MRASPASRDRAGRATPRAGCAVSAIRRPSADAPPALQLVLLPANSVRVLGYNDYRAMFMPLGWEETRARQAKGFFVSDPDGWARQAAGLHAFDALHRPHFAAADAIAFCARCCGELEEAHLQEAAE